MLSTQKPKPSLLGASSSIVNTFLIKITSFSFNYIVVIIVCIARESPETLFYYRSLTSPPVSFQVVVGGDVLVILSSLMDVNSLNVLLFLKK